MEENTALTITPYYWRNRERVLKSIAEKKATPEGRKAYNEYQRAYQKRYKARKLAVAKEIRRQQRAEFIKRISENSGVTAPADPDRIQIESPAALAETAIMRFISEIPDDWAPPVGNFVIEHDSWR